MSKTIDNRVVQLEFDNQEFEQNAQESLTTLQKLKQSLNLGEAAKNLTALGAAAGRFTMDGISTACEEVADRFSYMKYMGLVALSNLVTGAMQAGSRIANALIGPITSGGWNRAMNLEQANFMMHGLLDTEEKIEAVMKNVSDAVDGTAYSLDAAAKVAAQFTASGMEAGDSMEMALKAIAGTAAMTNSSFEEIGDIFTTVKGQGKLMAYQMNQLSFRGLNVAATLGTQLGKTEEEIRDMVSKSKISFETFSQAMYDAFGEHAKEANSTFQGALSNIRAALGRIGAEFATPFIKNVIPVFNAFRLAVNATKSILTPFFTTSASVMEKMSDVITKTIDKYTMFVEKHGNGIRKVFTNLIKIAETAYVLLSKAISPIKDAFDETFEAKTLGYFIQLTTHIKDLVSSLTITSEQSEKVKHIFKGFFSIFDTLWVVIKRTVEQFGFLGPIVKEGSSFIVDGLMKVSDILLGINQKVKESEFFNKIPGFFEKIGDILVNLKSYAQLAIGKVLELKDKFIEAFKSNLIDPEGFKYNIDKIKFFFKNIWTYITQFIETIPNRLSRFIDGLSDLGGSLVKLVENIFAAISRGISGFLNGEVMQSLFRLTEHGIFTVILLEMRDFTRKVRQLNLASTIDNILTGNFKLQIKGGISALDSIATSLRNFTNGQIDAQMITSIGKALLQLAIGAFIISSIDTEGLIKAMGAIEVLLFSMVAAIRLIMNPFHKLMTMVNDPSNPLKQRFQGGMEGWAIIQILTGLSVALLSLAGALKIISKIDIEGIIKSMIAVEILLFSMVAAFRLLMPSIIEFSKTMSLYPGGPGRALKNIGKLFTRLAVSIVILAASLKILASIPFTSMIKSLGAFIVLLVGMTASIKILASLEKGFGLKQAGVSMLLLSIGMIAMAAALKILATIPFKSMLKSLFSFVVMLASVTAALGILADTTIGGKLLAAGAAILIVSNAMLILSAALKVMSTVSNVLQTLALYVVGIAGLAGALNLLAVVPSSKLILAATAMLILAPALAILAASLLMISAIPLEKTFSVMLIFLSSVATIVLGLTFLTGVIEAIPSYKMILAATSMLIMASAVAVLAAAMVMLGAAPWSALGKLALLMVGLIAVSAALYASWEVMLIGAGVMLALFAALAGGVALLGSSFIRMGEGLIKVGEGVIVITAAMSALKDSLPYLKEIVESLKNLKGVFGAALKMAAIGGAFVIFGIGAAVAGAGLILIGTGMKLVGDSIMKFAVGLDKAGKILAESKEQISELVIAMLKLSVLALISPLIVGAGVALSIMGAGLLLVGSGLVVASAGINMMIVALSNLGEFLSIVIPKIKEGLASAFEHVKEAIIKVVDWIKNVDWKQVLMTIVIVIGLVLTKIAELLAKAWDWLKAKLPEWWEAIKIKLGELWEELKSKVSEKWEEFKEWISSKWEEFLGKFTEWKNDLIEKGKFIIEGLIEGIESAWDDIKNIPKKIRDAIVGGTEDEFDIESPSKVMYWDGLMIMMGLNNGLKDGTEETGTIVDIFGNIVENGIGGVVDGVKDKISSFSLDWGKANKHIEGSLSDVTKKLSEGKISWEEWNDTATTSWDKVKVLCNELNRLHGEYASGRMSEEEYKAATKNLEDQVYSLIGNVDDLKDALDQLNNRVGAAKLKQNELADAYAKGKKTQSEFALGMKKASDTIKTAGELTYNLTERTKKNTDATNKNTEAKNLNATSASKSAKANKDLAESLESTLTNQLNLFSKFEQKNPMNKDELLNNMRSQIKGMTDWAGQMNKLATMGIDQGLYKKLAEMGPQGAEYVGAFTQMTAEELAQANEMWAQSLVLPGDISKQIGVNFNEMGKNIPGSMATGIREANQDAVDATQELSTSTYNTMHDGEWKFGSPSYTAWQMGFWIDLGFGHGILENMHFAINAIETMCNLMVAKAKELLDPENFKPIGAGVVEGVQQGIEENMSILESAMEKLASMVEQAARSPKGFDTNSPSKRMIPIGEGVSEGLAMGIDHGSRAVVSSISDLSDNAVSQMKMTIANIASMINNEIDDPVITPVLDLSKVQAGAKLLNSTFSANAAIAAGQSQLGALQNGQYSSGNVVFNQYNNSPKALSRIDIYRDTRNMLSQFKQATT